MDKKTVICHYCHGSGYYICPYCGGAGFLLLANGGAMTCPACMGFNSEGVCPVCQGKKVIEQDSKG